LADFNNRYLIEGNNLQSSLMTDYLAKANGQLVDDLNPFDTKLAYDAYLLNPIDSLAIIQVLFRLMGVLSNRNQLQLLDL